MKRIQTITESQMHVVPLRDLCRLDLRQVIPGTSEAATLPYVGMEDIESGTGRFLSWPHKADVRSNTFAFDVRHVLYGKLRPYLNKVALPDRPGRCSTELLPLLPAPGVDRQYVAWLLRRPETVAAAMQDKTGSRMPRASMTQLMALTFPLPSLAEQQRIVAKLDEQMATLDHAEHALAEQQAAASTVSTAVLQQVFSSPDSKRWPLVALTEVLSLQYGKSLPESTRNPGEYPVMGSNGIVGYHDEWFVSGPTIVVGRKGSSGKVTWEDRNCFPIDTTYFVVPKAKNPRLRFLYFFLKWSNLGHLSEASGVPGLNRDRVYKLLCPIPPLPEQSQIVNRLEETSNLATILLEHLDNQRSAVAAVRSAFLDAAFSGEI